MFCIQRKRKRRDVDDDTLSVQSLNVVPEGDNGGSEKRNKRRSMVKMSSLVNMLSPATSKVGRALEVHMYNDNTYQLTCSPLLWLITTL